MVEPSGTTDGRRLNEMLKCSAVAMKNDGRFITPLSIFHC